MESSSQQLTFHILDILTRDEAIPAESGEDNGRTAVTKEMIIHLFGKTATGQSIRADVKGFRPFFYISIPSKATRGQAFQSIRTYLTSNKIDTTAYDLTYEEKQLFFGYHRGTKFPFARISVGSISMFRSIKNCFLNGETSRPALRAGKRLAAPFTTPPDVFEANLDPMLRFFHLRNIDPCGWITIKDVELTAADAAADREIHVECDWTDCEQVTGAVAPFLIASWDIECYSATGDFPLANKGYASVAKELYTRATDPDHATALLLNAFYPGSVECVGAIREIQTRGRRPSKEQLEKWLGAAALRDGLARLRSGGEKEECIRAAAAALDSVLGRVGRAPVAGDPMIQIGTVLAVAGQPARTERHIFVWPSCDPVEGAVVHVCPTEADMIRAWTAWMAERDPDILIGYNVFGFDEKYFWDRATELAVDDCEEIQRLGRLCEDGGRVKLEEKFLSSSALGDNIMHMWSIQGRLQVDMFHYVKRTVPTLPSYKLDEVTKNFMSGGLIKATQDGNALQLEVKGSWADARPGRYVCLLDDTGESLTDKLLVLASSKGSVRVAWEDRGDEAEPWLEATQWVIVKDDVSPAELFRLHGGSSADRARIAAYCVQDCDLVLDLYYKLEVFNTAMSMANVCAVPVGYIMTRGQGIKIESLMFKEAYKRGKAVMVLPAPAGQGGGESEQQDSYEGAIVLKPTIGLLDSPVGVADFASLYPSTIVSENISHDTLLWVKDFDHDGRLMKVAWQSNLALDLPAEIPFTDIEFDLLKADPEDKRKDPRKTAVGKRICRYAQDDKGLLPIIIEGLLAARKATRALIPKETDPLKIALLDAQQNAYKITANSLYGQLGSGTFKLRLQHLAASVTGYGRKQIMFAKEVIERFYGGGANKSCRSSVVYGDTDSLFVQFNPLNPETGERLTGREARVAAIELTGEAGHLVTQVLKAPHDFEFDKVYDPLLMFNKKLYAGKMYENDKKPDDYVYKYMGISIKRRGNAPLVKTIYGAALNKVLEDKDVAAAAEIVRRGCTELVEGRTKLGQLIITKSLKAEYAHTPPAHKVLADRIKVRDPGNAPAAGDRLAYVYIRPQIGQAAPKLQGERIETPQFVRSKGLTVDYEFYIEHQLMNPISQMFGLLLEHVPGFRAEMLPEGWRGLDQEKQFAVREKVAAQLLFGEALGYLRESSKQAFIGAMGGKAVKSVVAAVSGVAPRRTGASSSASASAGPGPRAAPVPAKKQSVLDSWLRDTTLTDGVLLGLSRKKANARDKLRAELEAETTAILDV